VNVKNWLAGCWAGKTACPTDQMWSKLRPEYWRRRRAVKALPATLEKVDREHIIRALRDSGGVVSTAATSLGLTRTTFEREDAKAGHFAQDRCLAGMSLGCAQKTRQLDSRRCRPGACSTEACSTS